MKQITLKTKERLILPLVFSFAMSLFSIQIQDIGAKIIFLTKASEKYLDFANNYSLHIKVSPHNIKHVTRNFVKSYIFWLRCKFITTFPVQKTFFLLLIYFRWIAVYLQIFMTDRLGYMMYI